MIDSRERGRDVATVDSLRLHLRHRLTLLLTLELGHTALGLPSSVTCKMGLGRMVPSLPPFWGCSDSHSLSTSSALSGHDTGGFDSWSFGSQPTTVYLSSFIFFSILPILFFFSGNKSNIFTLF